MTRTLVVAVVATDGTGMTDDLTVEIGTDTMIGTGTGKPCEEPSPGRKLIR